MADRKADKAPIGSGAASKAAATAKSKRQQQKSKLDEIFSKMPFHQKKK